MKKIKSDLYMPSLNPNGLSKKPAIFFLSVVFLFAGMYSGHAQITSTSSGGNWSDGSTWVGGSVPSAGSDVIVADGATVTLNVNPAINTLTVGQGTSGTLANNGTVHYIYLSGAGTPLVMSSGSAIIMGANLIKFGFTNTSGSVLFKTPVTSVLAECWGGGGGGGGAKGFGISIDWWSGVGAGGGGGAYTSQTVNGLIVNNTYSVTTGAGGAAVSAGDGGTGGSSWFMNPNTVFAVGGDGGGGGITTGQATAAGTPGAGGAADSCIPSTNAYSGGSGGAVFSNSGGGGGGAGSSGTGGNASGQSAGAGTEVNGGNGGVGVNTFINGNPGSNFGGGGGGGASQYPIFPAAGGAGAKGLVAISWTDPVTSIKRFNSTDLVSVSPNPANVQISLSIPGIKAGVMVECSVFNVLGEIMQQEKIIWRNPEFVNVKTLSQGIYLIKLESEGSQWTGKFVKQ